MATQFKQLSDLILSLSIKDGSNNPILISSLVGYGIELFDPSGTSIGKWGEALDDYIDGTNIFKADGVSSFELNLSSDEYGSKKGMFYAELLISYTDTDFSDSLRHLYSERKNIFDIGDFARTASTDSTNALDSSCQFTFDVSVSGSMTQVYNLYGSPGEYNADSNIPLDALCRIVNPEPGIYSAFEGFIYQKKIQT